MVGMFSVTGPGIRCSSEVACAPHTSGLEHSGPRRTSARATAELDQGLIHFRGKELGDRYVRLWRGAQLLSITYSSGVIRIRVSPRVRECL